MFSYFTTTSESFRVCTFYSQLLCVFFSLFLFFIFYFILYNLFFFFFFFVFFLHVGLEKVCDCQVLIAVVSGIFSQI